MTPTFKRVYQCACEAPVFFRNTQCLQCGRQLGYDHEQSEMVAVNPAQEQGLFQHALNPNLLYKRCDNFEAAARCNWWVPGPQAANSPAGECFCLACSLNRVVPSQQETLNQQRWGKIEIAKRRLVSQLLALQLPVHSKEPGPWHNPNHGIAFDFLVSTNPKKPVLTGHDEGLITINAQEADDDYRSRMRESMGEPYRTILGHFRHEIGHYYWDVLIKDSQFHVPFRNLFGDESVDYSKSLKKHYKSGPPADWQVNYVSSYASCHPWEDWAETWAHYLHMRDTCDIALSYGIAPDHIENDMMSFTFEDLGENPQSDASLFLDFLNRWIALTIALNDLSRGMGQRDFYPFVLSAAVVRKIYFVHDVVSGQSAPN